MEGLKGREVLSDLILPDGTPVNGETVKGISSDWAYDHTADPDAHMVDHAQLMLVGNFYTGGIIPGSGTALTANRLYGTPFFVPTTMTFDRIAVSVTAGVAGAMRIGIYNDDGAGGPGTLALDAGAIDITSVAVVTATISKQLTKGWYWLAGVVNATASLSTTSNSIYNSPLGYNATTLVDKVVALYRAQAYGALPAAFGGSLTYVGTGSATPFMALRLVSIP